MWYFNDEIEKTNVAKKYETICTLNSHAQNHKKFTFLEQEINILRVWMICSILECLLDAVSWEQMKADKDLKVKLNARKNNILKDEKIKQMISMHKMIKTTTFLEPYISVWRFEGDL